MGDLISRSALLEKRCKLTGIVDDAGIKHGAIAIPVEIIKRAPAIDAVEVVRCKDCRYATWAIWAQRYNCEKVRGLLVSDNHFCAFGKRREYDETV